ncbi:hypothetical protein DFH09DRAFT_899230, partial [Mycena vulgaris]
VSQVCIRWHRTALGTPTLWDTLELDSIDLWLNTKHRRTAMGLLKVALDRSARSPLSFSISIMDGMDCARILQLLAQHCQRWKSASFFCRASDLRELSSVKGNMPWLETLEVEIHDTSHTLALFQVAPRLTSFAVGGFILPTTLAEARLDQIHTFSCLGQGPAQVPMAVSIMPRILP